MRTKKLIVSKDPILVALIMFAVIAIIIVIFMIYYADLLGVSESISSSVIGGTVSAIGAVIGGIITFLGVRLTINYEIKKEQLDRYPEKLIIIDDIFNKMEKLDFSHEAEYEDEFEEIYRISGIEIDKMREFVDQDIRILILNSAKLNRSVYSKMKKLLYQIETILDSNNSSFSDRDNVMELSNIVKSIEDELEILENKYNRDIDLDL